MKAAFFEYTAQSFIHIKTFENSGSKLKAKSLLNQMREHHLDFKTTQKGTLFLL
jgi:hypothetical protein